MLSDGKVQSLQLHLQQDDNHFSSLSSKEICSSSSMMTTSSSPCSSFRSVYYGVASAGAVPFIWELQPGTPKYTFCDPDHDTITISTTTAATATTATTIPPPLTPPPSYFSTSNQNSKSNDKKSSSKKHKILNSIFPRVRINAAVSSTHSQAHDVPLSSLSWSSSSSTTTTRRRTKSSSSSSCSPTRTSTPLSFYLRSRFSSPRSSFDSRGDDGDVMFGSPTSTLRSASNSRVVGEEICNDGLLFRGCYPMVNMKKALLSIVGTSSSHGSSAQPSPTVAA